MSELEKDAELNELPDTVEKQEVLYEYDTDSVNEQEGVVKIYSDDEMQYIIDSKVGLYTVYQTYQSVDVEMNVDLSKQLTLTYGVTTTELETITEDYELWLCSEIESFFCGSEESLIESDDIVWLGEHKFILTFSSQVKGKFIEFMGDISPHSLENADTTTLYEQLPDDCVVTVDYVTSTHPEFDP